MFFRVDIDEINKKISIFYGLICKKYNYSKKKMISLPNLRIKLPDNFNNYNLSHKNFEIIKCNLKSSEIFYDNSRLNNIIYDLD